MNVGDLVFITDNPAWGVGTVLAFVSLGRYEYPAVTVRFGGFNSSIGDWYIKDLELIPRQDVL